MSQKARTAANFPHMKQRGKNRRKAREPEAGGALAVFRAFAEMILEAFRPFIEVMVKVAQQVEAFVDSLTVHRQTDYTLIGGPSSHFAHRGARG